MSQATATEKEFYTIADLCKRWSVSRTTIWREVNDRRRLRIMRIGGRIRISADELDRYEREA